VWEIYGMHRKYAVGGNVQSQEGYKTACSALCSFVIDQSCIHFISARSSVILYQSFLSPILIALLSFVLQSLFSIRLVCTNKGLASPCKP